MKNLENYISQMELNNPASLSEIETAETALGLVFPQEYKEFMLQHNGGEGAIDNSGYLALWTIEELVPLNDEYGVTDFTPDLIYFASDGGEMAYAFDKRKEKISIVSFPMDEIHIEKATFWHIPFTNF